MNGSACLAASLNLYFFPDGQVRPCCRHAEPLGTIGHDRLIDIWRGQARSQMVDSLGRGEYVGGCGGCGIEVAIEGRSAAYPSSFDQFGDQLGDGAWPLRMEFNLSSVCNLQCIQCNGDLSSSIRLHREGRAPMSNPYDDRFFEDLEAFIPHLRWAQFAGGEPFLAPESFRVWEMVERLNPSLACNVITNATQWNRRVSDVTERVPMGFVFSLDAVTKELYESIRIGADFDSVMANVEYLRGVAAGHGTTCSINFCLMAQNYRGFGDVLLFAEERGMKVDVSVVRDPPSASLASLDETGRRAAHDYLLAATDRVLPSLQLNADVWRTEVARVGAWADSPPPQLDAARDQWVQLRPTLPKRILEFNVDGVGPSNDAEARTELAALAPGGAVHSFTVDVADTVVEVSAGLADLLGEPVESLIGRPSTDLQLTAVSAFGEIESYEVKRSDANRHDAVAGLANGVVHLSMVALREPNGRATSARILLAIELRSGDVDGEVIVESAPHEGASHW